MRSRTWTHFLALGASPALLSGQSALFTESFEHGLSAWLVHGTSTATVVPSGDATHGQVLELRPNGDAFVMIRGSEKWGRVRMEGSVLFPTNESNYLAFLYNATTGGTRHDFGAVYIKGNDSYLNVNPHRDFNVARTLYDELRVDLTGEAAIHIGQWQRFAVEVVGSAAHIYVGNMSTPQLTVDLYENDSGALGLQPRSVGGNVWVDDVTVRKISGFSYAGPARPNIAYEPEKLITRWQVIGPLAQTNDDIGRTPVAQAGWRPFATDRRGGVITGRIVDTHGPLTVAYFRTTVETPAARTATLVLSTVDDLAVWVNGHFEWFVQPDRLAWYDVASNPKHQSVSIPITLHAGSNDIVVRKRGGGYASGGFFAALLPGPKPNENNR
jgi:hypothetical protein